MSKNLKGIAHELAEHERHNGKQSQFDDGVDVCEFVSCRLGEELTIAEGREVVDMIEAIHSETNDTEEVSTILHDVLTLAISDNRRDPRYRLDGDTHAALASRIREFFQHEVATLASKNNTHTLRLESGEEFEIVVRKKT